MYKVFMRAGVYLGRQNTHSRVSSPWEDSATDDDWQDKLLYQKIYELVT